MTDHDVEQLTAYIDDELGPHERRALEATLSTDAPLRALLEQLRHTVSLVEALPQAEVAAAPRARAQVLARLEAPPTVSQRIQAWMRPGRLVPVLGLVGAAAFAVVASRGGERLPEAPAEEELQLAQQLDVLEDYEVLGLESAEDLEVVAALHELEATP